MGTLIIGTGLIDDGNTIAQPHPLVVAPTTVPAQPQPTYQPYPQIKISNGAID
jgi:hypothetical protein